MNRSIFVSLMIAAAVASPAACHSSSNPSPAPTPGPTCAPPGGTQSVLVYPAPGATAIPDRFGQVIIGSTAALPSSWNVVLATPISPGGVAGGTFTTVVPPFPTPNATPPFANPVYQSSSFAGGTFPGEIVRVYLNDTATNCTPLGPLGSFTTQ